MNRRQLFVFLQTIRIVILFGLASMAIQCVIRVAQKALRSTNPLISNWLDRIIHFARLYEEETNALHQIAISLAGAFELTEVLALIMKEAMKLTNTDESSILLWDAQQEKFAQTLRIDDDGILQSYVSQARANKGQTRQIIDERRSIPIFDARQVPDFNPNFLEKGYRASLGVPLLNQEEVIGVLYIRDKKPREFSKRQVALMETLASQVAVAINRARRSEELINARTRVAWMGMVSAMWRHAIQGHAITIREEIQHLRIDFPQGCLDKIDERLAKIERLTQLIIEKPITPPLSEKEGVESVPVNKLLRERIRQLWENEPYKLVDRKLDLKLDNTVTVRVSPDWLRQIFDIILDNAVEAMADVSLPMLEVATRAGGATNVEIVFTDIGKGISKDILSKLFYERIDKPKGTKGLGTGLLMAQTIAQTYGGEIRIETTGSTGTSVVVSLPIEFQKIKDGT